jgi:hypothetical protein
VGEYARHDASGFEDPIASAVEWAELTVPLFAE